MPIFIWNPSKSWTPCLQRCPLQITTMQTKQQTCTGCTLEIKQTTSNNGSWSATSLWKQLWRNWKFRISISTNGAFAMVVKCCALKFMQVWMIVKLLMILPIRRKPPNLHGCCLAKTLGLGWRSCFDTNFPNVIHWISIGYHIHKLHHHSLNLTVRQWLEVSHVFFFNWATRSSPHFQSHFLFACSL